MPHRRLARPRTANRRYDMRGRSELADRTRSGILTAVQELLERHDGGSLTIDDVARAAGVSRATIYNQFGSRQGLLGAAFEDLARRIRYQQVSRVFSAADPLEALGAGLRTLGRAWSSCRAPMRRILALAVIDSDVGEVVADFERQRRAQMATLAQRLAKSHFLGAGLTLADATVMLTVFTSFQFFDSVSADVSTDTAIKRLERTALAAILYPSRKAIGPAP